MGGELIGLVAVILGMGVPLGALYTYYRVRKLRSEERLAAIARGVDIPMEPELNQAARSRRWGRRAEPARSAAGRLIATVVAGRSLVPERSLLHRVRLLLLFGGAAAVAASLAAGWWLAGRAARPVERRVCRRLRPGEGPPAVRVHVVGRP